MWRITTLARSMQAPISAETGLHDNDINVLTLYRGKTAIPNPKSTREIDADDRLLCFGKLDAMRGMLPTKARRRRRPKVQKLDTDLAPEEPSQPAAGCYA